jgi:aminopeptidase N
MRVTLAILFALFASCLFAQNTYPDVLHYQFTIRVSDTSNRIQGRAQIRYQATSNSPFVQFDLHQQESNGKGMAIRSVQVDGQSATFTHTNHVVSIPLSAAQQTGSTHTVEINYAGVPADGLIIGKNKFGDRTFFADNWPNRAHYWIPCHDAPIDKATVEFDIIAPKKYQAISNGLWKASWPLEDGYQYTRYECQTPIPTKVMVIGLAEFAIAHSSGVSCIPHEYWVYPKDKERGFYDYALGDSILAWFIQEVGPYAYEKMAHIQSTTMFGGMENAGAIFYGENTITGTRKNESLLAHEIAHQWFGNSVSEKDFSHIWLSEGFATYFTNRYLGARYGADSFQTRRKQERAEAIQFASRQPLPVVNPTKDYMQLLNALSYQKGGFVLHMLQKKIGDEAFMKGIRQYYQQYKNSNAQTKDLQTIMESVSGKNLNGFFEQWLYRSDYPILKTGWHYQAQDKKLVLDIQQTQAKPFEFPLTVTVIEQGKSRSVQLDIIPGKSRYEITATAAPTQVIIDPHADLFAVIH